VAHLSIIPTDMFDNQNTVSGAVPTRRTDPLQKALLAFGLVAPAVTFAIAISGLTVGQKTAILVSLAAIYIGICATMLMRHRTAAVSIEIAENLNTESEPEPDDIRDRLIALEEASEFFGSSLKPDDMFRLVASRVEEIFPFAAAMLLVPDEKTGAMRASHAYGSNEEILSGAFSEMTAGIAGLALISGEVEIDRVLEVEMAARPAEHLKGFTSAAAIPLIHQGEAFGVFQVFTDEAIEADAENRELLETIAHRIAPLFLSSRSLERTIANALTDPLTNLPNERAMFMVLENQLAESQRYRDERPLSLLTIDLKGFDEINQRFGHATGDNMLRHCGEIIRQSLRKMDFLARAYNDEFVVVLPTASEKMAADVADRIKVLFAESPFEISEHEHIKIWLNFGWATFWKDGESAHQLLHVSRLRKQQAKSAQPDNVVWFGKEYVN
jgi:diguanylate cyclase (GGDEF)-like protein